MSRSTSWLMVAKIPLLISSRMMSAGLTAEQLRELLDGDRAGQLDRATLARVERLDAGSAECAVATRRLAGPATAAGAAPTPGHGLLLRSVMFMGMVVEAPRQRVAQVGRERGLERPAEGALGRWLCRGSRRSGRRRRPGRPPAGLVGSHVAARRPHDPQELALRADRPARDAGSVRDAARRDGPGGPAYDATSPVGTAAAFFGRRLGLAAGGVARSPRARSRRRRPPAAFGCGVGRPRLRRLAAVGGLLRSLALGGLGAAAAAAAAFFGHALRLRRAAPRRRSRVGLGDRAPRPATARYRHRRPRPSPRRPRRRSGCRSASRSGARRGGRSGPRGRSPARASARGRSRSRSGAPRRCRPR